MINRDHEAELRSMRVEDLPRLLELYALRRTAWGEDHASAVAHVLADVDYEPDPLWLIEINWRFSVTQRCATEARPW